MGQAWSHNLTALGPSWLLATQLTTGQGMGQAWSHNLTALSPSWLLATQTNNRARHGPGMVTQPNGSQPQLAVGHTN